MAGIVYELIDVLDAQVECYEGLNTLAKYKEQAIVEKNLQLLEEASTKIVLSAPRLIASIPSAPLPQNKSKTVTFIKFIFDERILKSVSLILSVVGLTAFPSGANNFRPLNFPLITRTFHLSTQKNEFH